MKQTTSHILMVRPVSFGYNEETATNNAFQVNDTSLDPRQIREKATGEFDEMVHRLRDAGINVHVVDDSPAPAKPDAVFPNNWVTFHEDGTVVTYPINAPSRRLERRDDIIDSLGNRFRISRRIHLEEAEQKGLFLEGTGSLILDRPNKIAYACLSPRTDEPVMEDFCKRLGYQKVAFTAVDGNGQQIYHTNVMMTMGTTFVVVCLEAVPAPEERELLRERFDSSNKKIVEISLSQMMRFAGNMLQVESQSGESYLVMSEQAYQSLSKGQIDTLNKHTKLLHSPLYTIERYAGGSARCMMAEIFLQEKGA